MKTPGNRSSRRKFLNHLALLGGSFLVGSFQLKEVKKVALIGDSIFRGYLPYVSQNLSGKAELWYPEEDISNTVELQVQIGPWVRENKPDVIHINSGLNDMRTIDHLTRKNIVPVQYYVENVERIIMLIHRYAPGAIIIWATTTPVMDDKFKVYHENLKDYQLLNEDVIKYNEAAVKTLQKMGVAVNDLYGFVMEGDPESIISDDGLHYYEYGYELLAERVSNAIESVLKTN